jgi:hypothetical protein
MYFVYSTYSQLLNTTGGTPAEPNLAEIYYLLQLVSLFTLKNKTVEVQSTLSRMVYSRQIAAKMGETEAGKTRDGNNGSVIYLSAGGNLYKKCLEAPTTLYLHRLMTRSACPPGLAGSRL